MAKKVNVMPQCLDSVEISTIEDFDQFVNHAAFTSDEDCFLPFQVCPALLALPNILRMNQTHGKCDHSLDNPRDQLLSRKRAELSIKAERLAGYIIPPLSERANWSYGRFGRTNQEEQNLPSDCRTMLELMPTLRRMAALEQAAENAALRAVDPKTGSLNLRSTRRQAKSRRHHYFDEISPSLRRDEYAINSSEVGSLLGEMLMTYHPGGRS
jgi:hypothetical protein